VTKRCLTCMHSALNCEDLNATLLKFLHGSQLHVCHRHTTMEKVIAAVCNCHHMWFLNHCRCVIADNLGLSTTVLELLLIYIISNSSNVKTVDNNWYQQWFLY
jgi:hypothetical protein